MLYRSQTVPTYRISALYQHRFILLALWQYLTWKSLSPKNLEKNTQSICYGPRAVLLSKPGYISYQDGKLNCQLFFLCNFVRDNKQSNKKHYSCCSFIKKYLTNWLNNWSHLTSCTFDKINRTMSHRIWCKTALRKRK